MADFAALKKNRSSNLSAMQEKFAGEKKGGGSNQREEDSRYWKPTRDEAGNGMAIIRFLPSQHDDIPFIKLYSHGFQGPTGLWYINNSLTTINQQDPVGELNSKEWAIGTDEAKAIVRKRARRTAYVSNIYVVKDSANPAAEGNVYLFSYGKKIFDKLNDLMNPSFEDEDPVDPFDLWQGANFRLKIRKVEGYPNYDKSEFDSPSALLDDDDQMEQIFKKTYSLKELHDPKHFKSYEKLKAELDRVLGSDGSSSPEQARRQNTVVEEDDELDVSKLIKPAEKEATPKQERVAPKVADDEDDDLEYFRKLSQM